MKFNLKAFASQLPKNIMKITIKELLESNDSFVELAALKTIPVLTAYKLAKLSKDIRAEQETFTELRNAKIKELGEETLDKDGNKTGNWNVKKENAELFNDETKKMLSIEVELNVPEVKLADLGVTTIAPDVLTPLLWLVKE